MPPEDAIRWNKRYRTAPRGWYDSPRSFLLENKHLLPTQGTALDVAMGAGANAGYLARLGLTVVGVDISLVAVVQAKVKEPHIQSFVADLTRITFPPQYFDVILNFYYLQRDLWPLYAQWIKPGGVLFVETLTMPMLETKPEINRESLLKNGELRAAFDSWDILYYREGWVKSDHGSEKPIASLIARLPNHPEGVQKNG